MILLLQDPASTVIYSPNYENVSLLGLRVFSKA